MSDEKFGKGGIPWADVDDAWAVGPVDGVGYRHPSGSYVALGLGLPTGAEIAGERRMNVHFRLSEGQADELSCSLRDALGEDDRLNRVLKAARDLAAKWRTNGQKIDADDFLAAVSEACEASDAYAGPKAKPKAKGK